jgi:hypothetical protein
VQSIDCTSPTSCKLTVSSAFVEGGVKGGEGGAGGEGKEGRMLASVIEADVVLVTVHSLLYSQLYSLLCTPLLAFVPQCAHTYRYR